MEMEFSQAYDPNNWEDISKSHLQTWLDVWQQAYDTRQYCSVDGSYDGRKILAALTKFIEDEYGIQPYME